MKDQLESMSRAELEDLRAAVDEALETVAERERQAALAAADEAARAHGYSLAELAPEVGARRKSAAKGRKGQSKNPPKYRNPANPAQTWSGRGRKPQWIVEAEAAGRPLADFAI